MTGQGDGKRRSVDPPEKRHPQRDSPQFNNFFLLPRIGLLAQDRQSASQPTLGKYRKMDLPTGPRVQNSETREESRGRGGNWIRE